MSNVRTPEEHRRYNLSSRGKDPQRYLFHNAKGRAKSRSGKSFTITKEDIVVPDACPVLGIPLSTHYTGDRNPYAPSIDRIDNSRGYEPDNVRVTSWVANRMRATLSVEAFEELLDEIVKFRLLAATDDELEKLMELRNLKKGNE